MKVFVSSIKMTKVVYTKLLNINKASINGFINKRYAVLAAAKLIDGRYDSYKTVSVNIDFTCAIMSRFDCIIIVNNVHSYRRICY